MDSCQPMQRSMPRHLLQSRCRTGTCSSVTRVPTSTGWCARCGVETAARGGSDRLRGQMSLMSADEAPRLRGFSSVVQQTAARLRRVRAKSFFVGFGAPTWAVRNDEISILDVGQMSKELVIPRQSIDIDFHDPQIRHGRAEMSVHQRAEVAVKVMRRDVDLEGVRGSSDLH